MKVLAILYNGFKAAKAEPRLLGTVENELGLRAYLESQGHEFIVSSDKEGPNSDFQKHIADVDILITTPFHPGYLTRELMQKVVPAHEMIARGDWNVSDVARNAFDLEGKVIGTLGAGRIGHRVLQRLVPFNPKELLYYDYNPLPPAAEKAINARRVEDLKDFVSQCDVVTVNAPLHEGTKGLINKDLLPHFKKGAWLVNTARGAICNANDVAAALKSGQLNGYAGDVWNVQPAPKEHPWRTMTNALGGGNGMVPHYSGTTLDAQARYAAGTKQILQNFFEGREQEPGNVIVGVGKYETKAYGQR
ncbi:NAD-dependent formate dehydrogenase [Amylostereum chailletii]|nr:NAD-dependent formate dehydrogenase [Amylostereum chailletii]